MFNFIKGVKVPENAVVKEEYEVKEQWINANVSAENIKRLFEEYLNFEAPSRFCLFIEVPSKADDETVVGVTEEGFSVVENLHNDVYYLDNFDKDYALKLFDTFADVLINDGLSSFGFLSQSGSEIGKYKYNEIKAYSPNNINELTTIFDELNIKKVDTIVTAWDYFTPDNYGESELYKYNGKTIYDAVEVLKKAGLYKAEQRES